MRERRVRTYWLGSAPWRRSSSVTFAWPDRAPQNSAVWPKWFTQFTSTPGRHQETQRPGARLCVKHCVSDLSAWFQHGCITGAITIQYCLCYRRTSIQQFLQLCEISLPSVLVEFSMCSSSGHNTHMHRTGEWQRRHPGSGRPSCQWGQTFLHLTVIDMYMQDHLVTIGAHVDFS